MPLGSLASVQSAILIRLIHHRPGLVASWSDSSISACADFCVSPRWLVLVRRIPCPDRPLNLCGSQQQTEPGVAVSKPCRRFCRMQCERCWTEWATDWFPLLWLEHSLTQGYLQYSKTVWKQPGKEHTVRKVFQSYLSILHCQWDTQDAFGYSQKLMCNIWNNLKES